jgi:delta8-fatty-acid desaturase
VGLSLSFVSNHRTIMIATRTTPAEPLSAKILTLNAGEDAAAAQAASAAAKRAPRQLPPLTRAEIATRIASGQALVLKGPLVLNVTAWSARHPGGALALLHFVGRDAEDEMAAYHSDATLEYMRKYAVGVASDFDDEVGWKPLTPPIALGLVRHSDGIKGHWAREGRVVAAKGLVPESESALDDVVTLTAEQLEPVIVPAGLDRRVERTRSKAYHDLKKQVVDAGLFVPPGPLSGYGKDIVRYLLLGGGSLALFFGTTGWAGQMASAALLGFMWQQLTCELKGKDCCK